MYIVLLIIAIVVLGITLLGVMPQPYKTKKVGGSLIQSRSLHLKMSDDVLLAADVWLPAGMVEGEKIPTVLRATRYGRVIEDGFLSKILIRLGQPNALMGETRIWDKNSIACVLVDVRGTGASFGTQKIPWSRREIADLGEVVDWIIQQPWSDGKVGTYGVSYHGNTAEMILVNQHPAVVASIPMFSDYDPYLLARPGGLFNEGFIQKWHLGNLALDNNNLAMAENVKGISKLIFHLLYKGVKGVDGDSRDQLLKKAVEAHSKNVNVYDACLKAECRDDVFGDSGTSITEVSPCNFIEQIEASKTPMMVIVGMMDAGTVDGAIERFSTVSNPQLVTIGPWTHGGKSFVDPFLTTKPSEIGLFRPEIQEEMLRFFQGQFNRQNVVAVESKLKYYILGEGIWAETKVWPIEGVKDTSWYLQEDNQLSSVVCDEIDGKDYHTVNFEATVGQRNRWNTQDGGKPIDYGNRVDEDAKLLTYTSAPFAKDLRVVGNVELELYISSSTNDAGLFVYFEDVAPDGVVTYITEGQLRLSHRKRKLNKPGRGVPGIHTFQWEDMSEMPVGQIEKVEIDLYATAVLIKQGHKIRLAISGHDGSNFSRFPEDEIPTFTIFRDKKYPSRIILPTIEKGETF